MNLTPVLLYSHAEEPVTRALLSLCKSDEAFEIIEISLERLLGDAIIFDEIKDNQVKVQWSFDSGVSISNSADCYLINRVISVPEAIFRDFVDVDRAYAASEFRAYLAFAIESFPQCLAKPGPFGLSGNRYSLPKQWEIVKGANLGLCVPHYFLGDLSNVHVTSDLVCSSPYNYYYWKPIESTPPSASFAFKRPHGIPVICCIVGEQINMFPYRKDDELCSSCLPKIREVSRMLADLFDYKIAEILLFSTGNSGLNFGMISNIPYASERKSWFQAMIQTFFIKNILGQTT